MGETIGKLLDKVYINNEIRIRKDGEIYLVETSIGDAETSREITFAELSRLSRALSLMVFEHHNPDHYDIKIGGFDI